MIDQSDNCVYINMLLMQKFQKQCFSFIIVNMLVFMLHVYTSITQEKNW